MLKPETTTALVVTTAVLTIVAAPVVLTGVLLGYVFTVWKQQRKSK
jgi:nitrate reductase NapE component